LRGRRENIKRLDLSKSRIPRCPIKDGSGSGSAWQNGGEVVGNRTVMGGEGFILIN